MYLLRLFGSLISFLWEQLLRLLCPFRHVETGAEATLGLSERSNKQEFDPIPDVDANLTQEKSLSYDFDDFVLTNATGVFKMCLFYLGGYFVIAVVSFSYVFEKWSIIDSLYFSVSLLTTVGYGDLVPSSDATRLFLVWFSLYGVGILGIFLGIIGYALAEMQQNWVEQLQTGNARATLKALADASESNVSDRSQRSQHHHKSLAMEVLKIILLESPILVLVLVLALIMGYFEGWSAIQSIYFAVISVTTVGFGDVAPERDGTRLFAVLFIPIAVAVFGEIIARIAGLYISRQVRTIEKKFLSRSITLLDLQLMDSNSDGVVKIDEFLSFMLVTLQKVDKETIDELITLFHSLDVTETGAIGKEDLVLIAEKQRGWANLRTKHHDGHRDSS